MENTTEEKQRTVDQIYSFAANLMVNQKMNADETRRKLVEQGLDEESATIVVNNLEKEINKNKKEKAEKNMLYGALWFIGGVIVTAVTYSAASGGGTYVVAWGAIIFGAVQFFMGLANR